MPLSHPAVNTLIPLVGFLIASADTIRLSADILIVFSNAIRIFPPLLRDTKKRQRNTLSPILLYRITTNYKITYCREKFIQKPFLFAKTDRIKALRGSSVKLILTNKKK